MFEIELESPERVVVRGRLDAARADQAEAFLDAVEGLFEIDLSGLEYMSSSGLGVLLKTHKRLHNVGEKLKLVQVNKHIYDILRYSGFDKLFEIETE